VKFPGYKENKIFSVFADGRIKPSSKRKPVICILYIEYKSLGAAYKNTFIYFLGEINGKTSQIN
jgi:hypothetical protein